MPGWGNLCIGLSEKFGQPIDYFYVDLNMLNLLVLANINYVRAKEIKEILENE